MEPQRSSSRWRYSRWDGTQQPIVFDGDEVLAQVSDDLLYHGDLDAALRRLLQEGFTTRDGQRVAGLQELLERIRRRRQELASHDLSGLTDDVVRALDEVLSTERRAIDDEAARAAAGGDEDASRDAARRAAEHHAELDLLPPGLADQIHALANYDFVSEEARQRFEQLVEQLRHDLAQLQLDRAAGAMAAAGPEEREHLRAGLDALNRMLEQRAASEPLDPSFEQFMEQFGDLFPGSPRDLDELLAQMAQRMAAASALVASMTEEQRGELAALMEELLGDLDLAWQVDRLANNLRDALPGAGWDQGVQMSGGDPIGMSGAADLFGQLGQLGQLEQLLAAGTDPTGLAEVDPEAAEALLGPDAAASLRALAELTRRLEEAGLARRKEGRLTLTPRGLRRLGTKALDELFARLRRDRIGDHAHQSPGLGHEREGETKSYEHGDPFHVQIEQTIRNAIARTAADQRDGPAGRGGVELPIRLQVDDFAIERSEHLSAASTVLCVDLSLSMPMRDNFLAAKKVAMALQALIASRYPRDYLGLIGFSATAREIRPEELPEVSWDFAYGTNLQHALALSRKLLAHRSGSKQVIVITDGEPTAHVLPDGGVFFNYPTVPETLEATLHEVARCTRERIRINTFVLDATGGLRSFVELMTRRNRGRAFFTTPETLGDYVLVDFVEHRSASNRRLRHGA